ncbi:MAG TPA: PSD1 and planctomycete cytochrome C domain-containing protein [Roseimicrobium sp.]|nr:PSD1 and planctomycete cytochrome C domain-containing protein [Roseimicrobium sp.]
MTHFLRRIPCRLALLPTTLWVGSSLIAWAATPSLPPVASFKIDFARDIQPILSESCYSCHGPKKQEAGFRLDQKDVALKGGDLGVAIVPGKSAESLLIQAVAGLKDDLQMPRKGAKLTAEQIGLLRAWIDQGAVWGESSSKAAVNSADHWAFKAPVRPAVPAVKNSRWSHNPIDAFVLSRLEHEKLKPSAEADRITLIRRLSLDITGLPPSIEEVDAFVADKRKDAYEQLVDRLLASPHYGERWGRHWLDAARYADSDGFEKDRKREIWFYRDWVINAFNRDLPYDRFVIDQLAGDQLPKATQEEVVATGFLRNAMLNEEGGVDPEQFRMDAMFDRMDAIGKSVLGLTIQCAQCHNHKFDPLTQEEYYKIFAFLNNDHEAQSVVYTSDQLQKVSDLTRQMREIEADLKHRLPDWEKRQAAWEQSVLRVQPAWTVLDLENTGDNGQRYLPQPDGSLLAQGYSPAKIRATFRATNDLSGVTGFKLELLNDPNLPGGGPGRAFNGIAVLSDFSVEAEPVAGATKKTKVGLTAARSDLDTQVRPLDEHFYDKTTNSRTVGPISFAIDGNANTAWTTDAGPGRRNEERVAVFQCATNAGFAGGTAYYITLNQNHGGWNNNDSASQNLGRFRISVTTHTNPLAAASIPQSIRNILSLPAAKRTASQQAAVFRHWRTTVPEWQEANARIESLWKQWPDGTTTLTFVSRTEPRETKILRRGDWLKPSKPVTAGAPAFLNTLGKTDEPSRLSLARWLVDRKSPTTARVFVNRMWQAYFGTGIVATSEDFGMQADKPSHPELLDWLATEFMDRGWSIKQMHRLIVTSATYRQSSKVTPELYQRDPQNRLLARGSRLRVEGEIVRDIAFAASGLLNPKMGGPSIMAPAPEFLFLPPASYGEFPWVDATGDEKYRRSVYTFRRRSTPYPMLQTFDAPNGDSSCVRRLRSNSPLQALTTLNEPLFVEAAQALARKVVAEGGKTDADRINYAFRRTLSRPPTKSERTDLLNLLEKQRARLNQGEIKAEDIAGIDAGKSTSADATQLAAFTVVSRVLLNLDETITKE